MVEGDRGLNWLSYPSFAMCPNRFLAFLRISHSSRDVCWVGDSAVGTTSILAVGDSAVGTPSFSANLWSKIGLARNVLGDSAGGTISILAVGDSAVGTPSFSTNLCSKVELVGNVLLLSLSAKFRFAASNYDFNFCKTVVTKFLVTCSVLQFVSASRFGS